MAVSRSRKHLQICHHQRRVAQGLRKNTAGVFSERRLQLCLGAVRRQEGEVYSHLMHGFIKQIEGAAINGAGANDMTARMANVQNRNQGGCLAGRGQQRADAALQRGNFLFYRVERRVAETRIEKAVFLQIKKLAEGFGAVITERRALCNR